jgi:hypothetical protein
VVSGVRSDMGEEALRVAQEAERREVSIRLLGGVAIKLRAGGDLDVAFRREYADHDWIVAKGASAEAQRLFKELGYTPHVRFNTINGRERLLFHDEENGRQVDVFVGSFRMCHEIPFGERLALEPVTVPLAELLLTKLQIVQLNEKDVRDALALLHDHPVAEEDGNTVNARRVAALCASDWGLWRTITANLAATGDHLGRYELTEESKQRIEARVRELLTRIEDEPKTLRWKLRSKIGERKRWYELPEEVDGGP